MLKLSKRSSRTLTAVLPTETESVDGSGGAPDRVSSRHRFGGFGDDPKEADQILRANLSLTVVVRHIFASDHGVGVGRIYYLILRKAWTTLKIDALSPSKLWKHSAEIPTVTKKP